MPLSVNGSQRFSYQITVLVFDYGFLSLLASQVLWECLSHSRSSQWGLTEGRIAYGSDHNLLVVAPQLKS